MEPEPANQNLVFSYLNWNMLLGIYPVNIIFNMEYPKWVTFMFVAHKIKSGYGS